MSKYIEISHTVFNAPTDGAGEELDYITFVPNVVLQHDPSISADSFDWSFLEVQSNYKNATGHKTYATFSELGDSNKINPVFKLSNIQDGEVVFLDLGVEVTFSDGSKVDSRANITLYRGDPVNTSFVIQTQKNGRMIKEYIFESAIEKQILKANTGDRSFFVPTENTVQGKNLTISEYLSRKNDLESKGLTWGDVQDFDGIKNEDGEFDAPSDFAFSQSSSVQFVKNELALYSHGRSQDMTSISTLLYQNPSNFEEGLNDSPDPTLYLQALQNWYKSPPGFNTFVVPLFNPNVDDELKMYFPGRSAHGGGSQTKKTCKDVTVSFSWTPPTYPPDCPPGSAALICAGSTSFTFKYCVTTECTSC